MRRPDRPMKIRVGAFELTKRGAAKYDFRDPYHLAVSVSWLAFGAAFIAAELVINLFFALLYYLQPGSVANVPTGGFINLFFFSIETLATVGYGVMAPDTLYGHTISAIEIVTGMMFTAIMTGLLFVRFSKPRAKILYADKAVVSIHNGRPTLMLRIGNGRMTLMTHASARLGVLLAERSEEGQFFRRVHDLALERPDIPVFALTWTLMHVIDEASPFHGHDAESLREADPRLFLTVEARDHALGTQVQDIKDYSAADILFGQRFADAVTVDEAGHTMVDLGRISLLEPDEAANGR